MSAPGALILWKSHDLHNTASAVAALAVVVLGGCRGDDTLTKGTRQPVNPDCDTSVGDTGCSFYTGPTLIEGFEAVCSGTDIVIHADTTGWTSDAVVNMTDSANALRFDEEHHLASVSFGANRFWDVVEVTLAEGAAVTTWTPDVSSVFTCAGHITSGAMTYAIRVYDPNGSFADCATWGDDPGGYLSGAYWDDIDVVSASHELASCVVRSR